MQSRKNLRIAIVGCGIGGLTAALALALQGFEYIDVFEAAPELGFVGAGIQLSPNMARVLDRLDVYKDVVKDAVHIQETSIRDGLSNKELARVDMDAAVRAYGYPHMVVHRADLIQSLFNACKQHPPRIRFHFGATVTQVLSFAPTPTIRVTTPTGTSYIATSDLVLAFDGIKSTIRAQLLAAHGAGTSIQPTGHSAYRLLVPRAALAHDAALLALVDANRATRWIAPGRHVIAYPIRAHRALNVVAVQPDTSTNPSPTAQSPSSYSSSSSSSSPLSSSSCVDDACADQSLTAPASRTTLLATYADFAPLVRRLLHRGSEADATPLLEWRLRALRPAPRAWVAGRVALGGDAAHPSLPFLAQGAAQAVEDAGVLGVVLGRASSGGTAMGVEDALRVYERVRRGRAERLGRVAEENGALLHAERGERERRGEGGGGARDKWVDEGVQEMMYGHDCVEVAQRECARLVEERRRGEQRRGLQRL